MVGIWGLGGNGKTTIAEVIYNRDCNKFEASCYLRGIKDKYNKGGVIILLKQLLSQMFDCFTVIGCSMLQRRLCNKKVLIVLDDVDDVDQLTALASSTKGFGCGSRIITIKRDKHMLVVNDVNYIYEVQTLDFDKSLQLFCRHASKQNQPKRGFFKLSSDLVTYTQGLPLALKVLGRSLCEKEINVWREELEKLKEFPDSGAYDVLRVSYESLDNDLVKDFFLDIALFFIGEGEFLVRNILDQCGLYPLRAFVILRDKALLTISKNQLCLHELIREMAYEIVRKQSPDPRKRGRLCHSDDIYDALTKERNMGI